MFLEIFRFSFEWEILEWFSKLGHRLDFVFYLISELGSSVGILLFLTICYWCFNKRLAIKIACASFISVCFNNVLKMSFLAKRPFEYPGKEYLRKLAPHSALSDGATGTSFPSGHSQNISTLMTSVFLYFKKPWVRVLAVGFGLAVMTSRLYLGVHFPGDVFTGCILGILVSVVVYYLSSKIEKNMFLFNLVLCVIFLPFCLFKNISRDFVKGYGLLIGYFVATILEGKYVNFKDVKNNLVRILRYLLGFTVSILPYFILSKVGHLGVLETNKLLNLSFTFFNHALLSFNILFVVPLIFNKIKYLRGE